MALKHKSIFYPSKSLKSHFLTQSQKKLKLLKEEGLRARNNYLGINQTLNKNGKNTQNSPDPNNKLQKLSSTSPIQKHLLSKKSLPQQIIIRNLQKKVNLRSQLYLLLHSCHCKTEKICHVQS